MEKMSKNSIKYMNESKDINRCSISHVIKEMQFETVNSTTEILNWTNSETLTMLSIDKDA